MVIRCFNLSNRCCGLWLYRDCIHLNLHRQADIFRFLMLFMFLIILSLFSTAPPVPEHSKLPL